MKTLSVLLTFALFVATNALAAHLRHAHALPVRTATTQSNFHNTEYNP